MSDSKSDWQKTTLAKALGHFPDRSGSFTTSSGLNIEPVYTPDDLPGYDYQAELGYPGEYPYTRGIQPSMYRSRLWTMRQYAGFATAAESNRRFRYLLEQGQTGFRLGRRFLRQSDGA